MNLVTGATGLLGSHIAERLAAGGKPVRALVRNGSDTSFLDKLGVEKTYGGLTDSESLVQACDGADVVYHSAAHVGDWGAWEPFEQITIDGTRSLMEAAKKAGVRRFVHISSISAYGIVNGEGLVLDESAPLGRNLYRWAYYCRSKVLAEELLWEAHRTQSFPLTVIRPSWLYGERDRASIGRLISAIRSGKAKKIGPGDNRLNLVYAGNVADAAILAAESEKALGEAYNCCHDGAITQSEYLARIAEAIGAEPVTKTVPYRLAYRAAFLMEVFGRLFRRKIPPLVTRYSVWLMGRRCFFECRKLADELGWKSAVDYDTGIRRAVEWRLADENAASE
jgi:nucleoside-diphosphate-sugar epimerase